MQVTAETTSAELFLETFSARTRHLRDQVERLEMLCYRIGATPPRDPEPDVVEAPEFFFDRANTISNEMDRMTSRFFQLNDFLAAHF